jgi:hypothetical protein
MHWGYVAYSEFMNDSYFGVNCAFLLVNMVLHDMSILEPSFSVGYWSELIHTHTCLVVVGLTSETLPPIIMVYKFLYASFQYCRPAVSEALNAPN